MYSAIVDSPLVMRKKPAQQFAIKGEESLPMQFIRGMEEAYNRNILSNEYSVECALRLTSRSKANYRTVIHFKDNHLLNANIISLIESVHGLNGLIYTPPTSPNSSRSSSPVNTPQQEGNVKLLKAIASVESDSKSAHEQELSHATMDQLGKFIQSGRLNQVDLANVLRSCYFFEMTDFDAVMLLKTVNQLVEYAKETHKYSEQLNEEFNKIIPQQNANDKLEILSLALSLTETDDRLKRLATVEQRNKIGIVTKYGTEQANITEFPPINSPLPSDARQLFHSTQLQFYISAIEQATLLFDNVVLQNKSICDFFNEYCNFVNNDTDQLEYRRIFKVLLMRKVINKMKSIIIAYQRMEESVPIFNYKTWNANNLRIASKVREMRKTQCVVNNIIKV